MEKWKQNNEYIELVKDISLNDEFKKLKKYKHHGDNRYDHSFRVSYYSYLIAKKFNLKTESIARAGLLHDFFLVNNQAISLKERIIVLIVHPKIALENSKRNFKLNELEENIILSHMFPIYLVLPKHIESIIVNIVDDFISIYERIFTIKNSIINKINRPIKECEKVNN